MLALVEEEVGEDEEMGEDEEKREGHEEIKWKSTQSASQMAAVTALSSSSPAPFKFLRVRSSVVTVPAFFASSLMPTRKERAGLS